MSNRVAKLQALLERLEGRKAEPKRHLGLVLVQGAAPAAQPHPPTRSAPMSFELDDALDGVEPVKPIVRAEQKPAEVAPKLEQPVVAESPKPAAVAPKPEAVKAVEPAAQLALPADDDDEVMTLSDEEFGEVEMISDLDDLGIEMIEEEPAEPDTGDEGLATTEAARKLSEPPSDVDVASEPGRQPQAQVEATPLAVAAKPEEVGTELEMPLGTRSAPLGVSGPAPTAAQLGSTLELDEPMGPPLELDTPKSVRVEMDAEPDKLEMPLARSIPPGAYDAQLTPPPGAREDLQRLDVVRRPSEVKPASSPLAAELAVGAEAAPVVAEVAKAAEVVAEAPKVEPVVAKVEPVVAEVAKVEPVVAEVAKVEPVVAEAPKALEPAVVARPELDAASAPIAVFHLPAPQAAPRTFLEFLDDSLAL